MVLSSLSITARDTYRVPAAGIEFPSLLGIEE